MEPTLDTSEFQDVPTSQLEAKPNGPMRSKAHEEPETTAFEDYTRLTKTLESKRQNLIADARGRRDKAAAELIALGDGPEPSRLVKHRGRPAKVAATNGEIAGIKYAYASLPRTLTAFGDGARRGRPRKTESAQSAAVAVGTEPVKRPRKKADVCKICEASGHDGRAHRFQGKKKKAFTAEQLAKLKAGEKVS